MTVDTDLETRLMAAFKEPLAGAHAHELWNIPDMMAHTLSAVCGVPPARAAEAVEGMLRKVIRRALT